MSTGVSISSHGNTGDIRCQIPAVLISWGPLHLDGLLRLRNRVAAFWKHDLDHGCFDCLIERFPGLSNDFGEGSPMLG